MRNPKIAAAAAAIACLSIMSVAAFTPRQPEMAQGQPSVQAPALASFYVPAQHVNMGRFEEAVEEMY
jgi:hypothetical protein